MARAAEKVVTLLDGVWIATALLQGSSSSRRSIGRSC